MPRILIVLMLAALTGCVSVDSDVVEARQALLSGQSAAAVEWSEDLANDSWYSKNLGLLESGRVRMLRGEFPEAEAWFRKAIDTAVDRKESSPKIKLGDVTDVALASTMTDDRTMEYYLAPYELNLALTYGLIAQAVNGKKDDALADARLAVYIQDNLAETYGADIEEHSAPTNAAANRVFAQQSEGMADVMAGTRNSYENPVLWWLTGVLFESDGDIDFALQSYRKALAVKSDNLVFAQAVERLEKGVRTPQKGKAKLVVIYEEGLVPLRESLKVPVPIYTAMSIDLPIYSDKSPYGPRKVAVTVGTSIAQMTPALDVRALAYRDLNEHLPGVITRNITRALVQAGAQAAVNTSNGNQYARLAVFVANAVVSAIRRADTRCWATLPDGQQVWASEALAPSDFNLLLQAEGAPVTVPISLKADKTTLLWVANCGGGVRAAMAEL